MKILLTGGSACGKSTYGENLALRFPAPRYYIATMRPYGAAAHEKIARHRLMRAQKGFVTIERDADMQKISLPARGTALLECICNLTANEMFDSAGSACDPVEKVLSGASALYAQTANLIIVTNDVGSDTGRYAESTLSYVRALGEINNRLANWCDCVYELVCGIPLVRKGRLL